MPIILWLAVTLMTLVHSTSAKTFAPFFNSNPLGNLRSRRNVVPIVPLVPPPPPVMHTVRRPSLPIQLDHYCKELPFFQNVQEAVVATTTSPGLALYSMDERNPNTLHAVLTAPPTAYQYDYIVAMMMDERGLPSGHFHLFPCSLSHPPEKSGIWKIGIHCTKTTSMHKSPWGNTQFAYVESNRATKLKQSFFWSWIPEDGPRPQKLQLRFGYIKGSKFWSGAHSPVLEFKHLWIFEPAVGSKDDDDTDDDGLENDDEFNCYQTPVSASSIGNFATSKDQTFIETDRKFVEHLNPWFINATLQASDTKHHFSSTTVLPGHTRKNKVEASKMSKTTRAPPIKLQTTPAPPPSPAVTPSTTTTTTTTTTAKPAVGVTRFHFSSTTVRPGEKRKGVVGQQPTPATATTTSTSTTPPTTTTRATSTTPSTTTKKLLLTTHHFSSTTVRPGAKKGRVGKRR